MAAATPSKHTAAGQLTPPRPIVEYHVGWVCALPIEMAAARAMLEAEHGPLPHQDAQDTNNYVLGHVHNHNVVIACLPSGVDGTNAAATVAANMRRTFRGLHFGLLVGIGGGIPNLERGWDIRLGDVVVSQPEKTHGGIVQYDKGKALEGGQFERKGSLNKPPSLLLTALSSLKARHEMRGSSISEYLSYMIDQYPVMSSRGYTFPGAEQDVLCCDQCTTLIACEQCQDSKVHRSARRDTVPVIHYGVIASGNQVIKDSVMRDRLGEQFDAKCVEMEAAGLMDDFPCLVIRGVCDYADSHKNDSWHRYAAATAAAYAKEVLSVVVPKEVARMPSISDDKKYDLGLNLFNAPDMAESLFVGRAEETSEIESILQPSADAVQKTRQVAVVGGMGGVGKTQLAIAYAKRHYRSYSSIFWLNAESELSLKSSLRALAGRFATSQTLDMSNDDHVLIHVSNWLSEMANAQWLLIFDNYDDPNLYSITRYYPAVAHGSIIITTRRPDWVSGTAVMIRAMSREEEGLRILALRSGRDSVMTDVDAVRLAKRLDGYPLALATAGAFLRRSSLTIAQYLQRYEDKWKITDTVRALPDYPSRTLYSTWDLSFQQIEKDNTRAANFLKLLAYFDHQELWYDLVHGGRGGQQPDWFVGLASDVAVYDEVMQILADYCFVETRQTGSHGLHICVHDWISYGLNPKPDATMYWLAFDCVAGQIADEDFDVLFDVKFRRATAHAIRLVHDRFEGVINTQEWSEDRSADAHDVGELLRQQGQLKASARMLELALAGKEKTLGAEHRSTLDTVNNLGALYSDQGKLEKAEQMYERALAGSEKTLGVEHPSTLRTVNNLGNLYWVQGKLEKAEQMYKRALAGYEKAGMSLTISALTAYHNMGLLCHKQGRMAEAKNMFHRAVSGQVKVLGPQHSHTLDSLDWLKDCDGDIAEDASSKTNVSDTEPVQQI